MFGFPGFRRIPLHACSHASLSVHADEERRSLRTKFIPCAGFVSSPNVSPAPGQRTLKRCADRGGPTRKPALAYVTRSPRHAKALPRASPQHQAASELQRPLSHSRPEYRDIPNKVSQATLRAPSSCAPL